MNERPCPLRLGRELLSGAAMTPDGVNGVLGTSPTGVNLSPPDEVSARPELRPKPTGRWDDFEVRHSPYPFLTVPLVAARTGSADQRATGDGRNGLGRLPGPVSSRLRLHAASWRGTPTHGGGLSANSGRQLFSRLSRSTERLTESPQHDEIGVQRDSVKTTYTEWRKPVAVLQVTEGSFDRCPASVQVTEPLRVARDAREQPTAESERQSWLVLLCTPKRNDGFASTFLALGIDPIVVVALVHRTRLGHEAASVQRVEEWSDEVGLLPPRRLDTPRERQPGSGANGKVQLEAVEASTLTGTHGAAMPPARIRIAEPVAGRFVRRIRILDVT
jgi:hypothetical protein